MRLISPRSRNITMKKTMIGRGLAAMLLLGATSAAHASGYYQGAVAGGSGTPALPYQSGLWYQFSGVSPTAVAVPSSNKAYCTSVVFRSSVTVTDLGAKISTAATGGTRVSLAVYGNTFVAGTGNRPFGAALASVVDLDTTTIATRSLTLSTPAGFQPGTLYWQCVWSDGNPAMAGTAVLSAIMTMGDTSLAALPIGGTNGLNGLVSATLTYPASGTAWPTFDGTGWSLYSSSLPVLAFKAQ